MNSYTQYPPVVTLPVVPAPAVTSLNLSRPGDMDVPIGSALWLMMKQSRPNTCNVEFCPDGQVVLHVEVDNPIQEQGISQITLWHGCIIQLVSVPGQPWAPTDGLAAEARLTLVNFRGPHPSACAAFEFHTGASLSTLSHWKDIFQGLTSLPPPLGEIPSMLKSDTLGNLTRCRFTRGEGFPRGGRDFVAQCFARLHVAGRLPWIGRSLDVHSHRHPGLPPPLVVLGSPVGERLSFDHIIGHAYCPEVSFQSTDSTLSVWSTGFQPPPAREIVAWGAQVPAPIQGVRAHPCRIHRACFIKPIARYGTQSLSDQIHHGNHSTLRAGAPGRTLMLPYHSEGRWDHLYVSFLEAMPLYDQPRPHDPSEALDDGRQPGPSQPIQPQSQQSQAEETQFQKSQAQQSQAQESEAQKSQSQPTPSAVSPTVVASSPASPTEEHLTQQPQALTTVIQQVFDMEL